SPVNYSHSIHQINIFFFSSRRRHTRSKRDWSSDVCSSDLYGWIFFYQSAEFLDDGNPSAQLVGNAPIIVNRDTCELRVTGVAKRSEERRVGKECRFS